MDHNRKRSASRCNLGSVVDYETENDLHIALMAVEEGSPELNAMLAKIQGGQPVQKVSW